MVPLGDSQFWEFDYSYSVMVWDILWDSNKVADIGCGGGPLERIYIHNAERCMRRIILGYFKTGFLLMAYQAHWLNAILFYKCNTTKPFTSAPYTHNPQHTANRPLDLSNMGRALSATHISQFYESQTIYIYVG